MVEIRYSEHYEQADLVGKSVAEVREQYKSGLGIPDRARAKLNGKELKKKLEAETKLNDGDELSFAKKSRKALILIGAFLLALAMTGSTFAYAWTTASFEFGATSGGADFATVDPATSPPTWTNQWSQGSKVFGKLRDEMPTGDLFDITYPAEYNGDLKIHVYLTNADGMSKVYQYFNMKVALKDSLDANVHAAVVGHQFQLLTLDNAEVTFDLQNGAGAGPPYHVNLTGGSFCAHPYSPVAWRAFHDPQLYCEVHQR